MSYATMKWAMEVQATPTQKHVLLVLATHANEDGEAFPSIQSICNSTGLSDRAVRKARLELIAAGILEKSSKFTRNGVRLNMARHAAQPAPDAGKAAPRSEKPASGATKKEPAPDAATPARYADQPAPDAAPHNSQLNTINNHYTPHKPPKASKPHPKPKQEFDLPDWIPVEAWHGWLEMRRSIKKPATPRAMEIAVKRLAAFKAQGHDPSDILETSTLNNWQGLFAPKSQRPHGQQAAPRMSESERNRNIIFEEMRAQYRSQDHANSDRIIFQ